MKKLISFFNWLKEATLNLLNLLGNLFLIIISLVMFKPLFCIAVPWKLWVSFTRENRKAREILSGTGKFFCGIAIALDQLGNVAFGGLFNDLLIKNPSLFNFGRSHETISEVLGWNQFLDNLTPTGKVIVGLVNFCDFTQEEHCRNAMRTGIEKSRMKIQKYQQLKIVAQ